MALRLAVPDFRFAALCLAGAAMPWSKAGLSIGMGLLILASLIHARPTQTFRTKLGATTLALLIPFLIAALISEDLARGWKEWTSLWPLLFPFLGAAAIRDAAHPQRFLIVLLGSTSVACLPALGYLIQQIGESGTLVSRLEPPTNIWLYTLALATGALIAAGFSARRDFRVQQRALAMVLLVAHLLALLATRRRLLLLLSIVLVGLFLVVLHFRERPKRGLLVVGLGGLALLAAAFAIDPRLSKMTDPGQIWRWEQSRIYMWEFAIDQYMQHPVFGMGLGDVRAELHAFADEVEADQARRNEIRGKLDWVYVNLHHAQCHSNFLHTMAAAGTLGLLGMLAWMLSLPAVLVRGLRRHPETVLLGLSAWALFFLGGVTDASLYSSSRLSAFTLVFAYAWGMLLRPDPAPTDAAVD